MIQERILELAARQMGRSATPEELAELEALLSQHPQYRYLLEVVNKLSTNKQHLEKIKKEEDLEKHGWDQLQGKLNVISGEAAEETGVKRTLFPRLNKTFLRIAAVLIPAIVVLLFVLSDNKTRPPEHLTLHEVNVQRSRTSIVTLPDGSKVWLNAGSKLTYPDDFSNHSERKVTLEGEGYFDVARDEAHPFLVHTSTITVKVLGTKFNVRAYPQSDNIETTLFSGNVEVSLNSEPGNNIALSPREKLIVPKQQVPNEMAEKTSRKATTVKYQVSTLPENASDTTSALEVMWMKNKLVFSDESFESIAAMLERWYNVRIIFLDEALKKEVLSGTIERESLDQALQLLQMTTKFNYTTNKNEVFLTN
jgi:ferric-dicitrate binding protein FerR (iron transport regulator)